MRIWVTRDEAADGPLSTALRSAGLDVLLEPVLQRTVVSDAAEQLDKLGPEDWLVLTSAYAIKAVAENGARAARVAVVGEASRREAEARGFRVHLVATGGDAKSLFEELRLTVNHGRICYPRSSLARPPAPWPGVEVLSPVLYVTEQRQFDSSVIESVDVVSVVSPSAVDAVGPVGLPFASIGPSTSAAIRKLGLQPWIEAPLRSFESLACALADRVRADQRP
ncbi:MAG: uroporphyrinogen-III synthase [Phycisphaerae bacterium]